jgi:deferrochelatase/peroxidase EfeB
VIVKKQLELLDIQGNIVRAYGRFGYPVARYVTLNIRNSTKARQFVSEVTKKVTTAVDWRKGTGLKTKPDWTVNIAFSYQGLKELEVPRASLAGFSPEFAQGMKARKDILGDLGPSDPKFWDPIWRENRETRDKDVHILITLNGLMPKPKTPDPVGLEQAVEASEEHRKQAHEWLLATVKKYEGGIIVLGGHCGPDGNHFDYQDVKVLFENGLPTAKEHFGYTDGISDPVFEGVPYEEDRVDGRGKQMKGETWAPLAAGEFLLGHIDEAHEYPPAPKPVLLARNGTYMIYRKLHENVATFDSYLKEHASRYPGDKDGELLAAKFVGRWRDNGAPLTKAPDYESKKKFDADLEAADLRGKDKLLADFTFDDDMSGAKCPFSAHVRRINPRASLEFTRDPTDPPGSMKIKKDAFDTPGALTNRRRILRRGLPYGIVEDRTRDDGNHGIVIMMLNADINRQFEFVQQQWINYGNDFKAANDKEILLGSHNVDGKSPSKAVLQVDPNSDDVPYILSDIPLLVETRGGEYFFVPSMTALRMIARGVVDPT